MRFISLALLVAAAAATDPMVVDENLQKNINEVFGDLTTPKSTVTLSTNNDFNLDPSPMCETAPSGDNEPCDIKEGEKGVCVPYYQCDPETKRAIVNGETLIDIRVKECRHYLDVCCKVDSVNTTEAGTGPRVEESKQECGFSNIGAQTFRIVNDGTNAEYGEFPWMTAVMKRSDDEYVGGGSIIHPKVILTTAHKVISYEPNELKVRAGEYDTQTDRELCPHQDRNVIKIITHEDFYQAALYNNVALLILDESIHVSRSTPNVGIACLGKEMPPPGTPCHSMGWGKTGFHKNSSYASILKKINLPLVSHKDCENALRGTRLGSRFTLHRSFTCAGGGKDDACYGDGGSSLVCQIGKKEEYRYAIFGMVVWGIGCGQEGIPGVYLHVPKFHEWVKKKLAEESINTGVFDYDVPNTA